MLIDRRTFVVKKGKLQEAAQLLLELRSGAPERESRGNVMIAAVGPFDVLCTEIRFEDWAAYHTFWDEAFAPDGDWWERWNALTDSGGTHEVWRIIE